MSGPSSPRGRYRRLDVAWRDLGDEVLVLAADPRAHVLVLGGGSATVWRYLDDWVSPDHLTSAMGADTTDADVLEALELIVCAGVAEREDLP